jgi:hypothetical protein
MAINHILGQTLYGLIKEAEVFNGDGSISVTGVTTIIDIIKKSLTTKTIRL